MRQVLVAEDEVGLRRIAVDIVKTSGFNVFEANDGEEALIILNNHPEIEVLVSDIKMPRMDGYALTGAALTLRPKLRVLLMTGHAQEPPASLVGVRTLLKPFNLEHLCELVGEMLPPSIGALPQRRFRGGGPLCSVERRPDRATAPRAVPFGAYCVAA